jgi:hypothetical protein
MAAISMVYPQYVWAKEYIFLSLKHWEQDREMFSTVSFLDKQIQIFVPYLFLVFSRFSASNSSREVHR